ncbi:hypothetical protein C7974DRAFT_389193 [Boeremia exigua]|uniref:uncharacterized protein n=1 Tax=Boeremia exigua TaxID=749465 RepID=UPI001E8CD4BF|nr:uncharacterized protein C7974DRAFT_389193 [Boeremia exigua]KAH6639779.1 hypothetical protein C7974DRAFT_389193 [Boeremia exigua]
MGVTHRRTLSLSPPPLSTLRGRLFVTCSLVLLTCVAFFFTPKSTITRIRNHIPGSYPYVKPSTPDIRPPVPDEPAATPPPPKLIVKAQLKGEDLNWLLKLRPEWRNQVITIDASFAHLHAGAQRVDKGRIADAYLRWLITNYDYLSEVIVFVPPGLQDQEADKEAWRIPNKEPVQSIESLDVAHVKKAGYAPLRCPSKVECEDPVLPSRDPPDQFRTMETNMGKAWMQIFNATGVPEKIGGASGNSFVVSRDKIRQRSVEEYTRYWSWLASTKIDDDSAGEVFEKIWHVIFGQESAWCPTEAQCRCDVFGKC